MTMNKYKLFNKIVFYRNKDHMLQEQLDLAKTKYDDVHAKLDKSEELSTNRSAQLDNMHAVRYSK